MFISPDVSVHNNCELEYAFTEIHSGFFTESEIKDLVNDKDYWLNKTQIEERWANKKALETK